ncbi:MAG: hypothetical protein ACKV2T_18805 [Kofleriaceae bacterium]
MTARQVLALALLPACLTVPEAPKPECVTTEDCQGVEVCEDGTCWGDPPAGEFAFVLSPPMDRPRLVSREIRMGTILTNGRIDGLMFEKPVKLDGRLSTLCTPPLECDRAMLDASVTITRASLFEGGPGFRLVTMTALDNDGPKFDVDLPPGDPDVPYTITIVPMPRADSPATSSTRLAEVVPPMRFQMPVLVDTTKTLALGGLSLATVEGTLLASAGGGLEDYRVVAMGRWEEDAPSTEVSTVAYTASTGAFRLTLSPDLVGSVDIVARPSDSTSGRPTLHLLDVPTAIGVQRTLTEPAGLGNTIAKTIAIMGKETSGAPKAVVGARVRVSALIGSASQGTAGFVAEGTTDDAGRVVLNVLDGDAIWNEYRLEVVPPAGSTVGAIYDQPFAMTDTEVQLPKRTLVTGVIRDVTGATLAGVTVTARPALRFVWSLDDKPQTFLNSLPLSTAVTNNDGIFSLFVDPTIDEIWGYYDLNLDPARSTGFLERAPTWVKAEIEIPRDAHEQVSLGDIPLPDAAFVHGLVVDHDGNTVKDAEVKVFRKNSYAEMVCDSVRNAPKPCPTPALLLGRDAASATGMVELTLPR